jgi:translocator protein
MSSTMPRSDNSNPRRHIPALLVSLTIAFTVAAFGEIVTAPALHEWYLLLSRPVITPPGWVFAPVWTVLYITMAVAAWLVWLQRFADPVRVRHALGFYALQLSLNLLWSMLFFGLHSIILGQIEILLLLAAIGFTIAAFRRFSALAAWLMAVNFLWVAFAAILNLAFWLAN